MLCLGALRPYWGIYGIVQEISVSQMLSCKKGKQYLWGKISQKM